MTLAGGSYSAGLDFGSQKPKPAKKKSKSDNPWGPDIVHRFLDQTEEAALGLALSPWYIGKSVIGDVKNVFLGKPGDFATDDLVADIAKTTWRDFKKRWVPLIEGDLGGFWNAVEHDPLGFTLDIATVLTGGGAAVGKAGKAAAKAGGVETWSTRRAGLTKTDRHVDKGLDFDNMSPEDINLHRALASETVKLRRGVVDKDGFIWDGPVAKLSFGKSSLDLPLSNNPVIRGRQVAVAKLGNRYPNMWGLGANKRTARMESKLDRRLLDREYLLTTTTAERALRDLDGAELSALSIMPWREAGVSRDVARGHYETMRAQAVDDAAKAWEAASKDTFKEKSARAADLRVQQIEERLAAIGDDDIWNLADPQAMPDNVRAAAEELVNVSRETTRKLWEASGGTTREGVPIDFDDFWALQRSREARRMLRGDGPDELDLLSDADAPIPAAELAEKWRNLRYSFVRPHMLPREFHQYGRKHIDIAHGKPNAKNINRQRRNNFTLFDDAMDIFDPRVTLEAARQVAQYNSTIRRVRLLEQAGSKFASDAEVPKGWQVLSRDGTLQAQLTEIERWLNEDGVVLFGKDQPLLETQQVVSEFRAKVSDGIFAAPKPVAQELLAEFKSGHEFLRKYDKATGFWRTATLALRPTWVTANLISQLTLLSWTHGMIKGGAAYIQAVRMGTDGSLLRKTAPDTESAGMIRDALQERGRAHGESLVSVAARKAMGQKGAAARYGIAKAWGGTERIMQFNAWLTDDLPRRGAFLAEIKPHVRRIQNETGMSFEDAALKWLEDPRVVDDLAVKVANDLIDFRSLTQFEKAWLRRLMPFWSWIRGATGRHWRMAMDEPWKMWSKVNRAEWAIEESEEQFGDLPDFLVGMLPLGESGKDQQRIIQSLPLIPSSTFGDVAGMLKSLTIGDVQVGGSNPMSTANPYLKSLIEAFTNRDLFYGTPLDYGAGEGGGVIPPGYLGRFGERVVSSFPQQRTIERLVGSGDQGSSTLYENSALDTLLSYFLLPTKQLNIKEANERAKAQKDGAQYGLI